MATKGTGREAARSPFRPRQSTTNTTAAAGLASDTWVSHSTTPQARRRPRKPEIVPLNADAGTLIPTENRNSLVAWFNLYMAIEAGTPDSNTFKAKQSDLSRFIAYFRRVTGSDHPDQWTRSTSQGFLKDLLRAKSDRTGKKLAPTTVNRVLATLRNAARWIHHQRPFLAGCPMERISDLTIPEPEWRGLADVDVTRLKSAAEQLVHIQTRADQNALRDQAILLVMLDTALRVSELTSLDLDQYEGKHFRNVKRKGNHVTDRVFVGQAARESLDRYVREIRGDAAGPLFQSKRGRRLAPQNIADALGGIVAQANTRLSAQEQIRLTPHVLRHTALRKMAETKGIRYAQQMAGHASTKYIWRYVQPSRSEMEEAVEELFD